MTQQGLNFASIPIMARMWERKIIRTHFNHDSYAGKTATVEVSVPVKACFVGLVYVLKRDGVSFIKRENAFDIKGYVWTRGLYQKYYMKLDVPWEVNIFFNGIVK